MKSNKNLFIIISAAFLLTAVPASAQTHRSYCWPEKQCKDKGGQYARTAEAEGECLAKYGFCYAKQAPYDLQIRIGETKTITGFAQYVETAYKYLIGIVSIIAIVMIMVGGLRYLTAGGNSGAITQARQIMSNAAIGLILTLGSYTLLQTINPALTKLTLPPLKMIAPESASQWCPNDGEYAGKFKCGDKFTKTSNPPAPISDGYCLGSACPKKDDTCTRPADIIDAPDKTLPPQCFPQSIVTLCKIMTNRLKNICPTLSTVQCEESIIKNWGPFPTIPACTRPLIGYGGECEADVDKLDKTCANFIILLMKNPEKFTEYGTIVDEELTRLENLNKK